MRDDAPFSTWPGPFGHTSVADEDLRQELRATLLAMRELGPEFDQAVTDAFIDRVEPALATKLIERNRAATRDPRAGLRGAAIMAALVIAAMMLAGPFIRGPRAFGPRFEHRGFYYGRPWRAPNVPNPPQAPSAPPAVPAAPSLPVF